MPTEGGRVRDALVPAVERLPELLYRGPNEPERPLTAVSSGAPTVCGHDRVAFEDGEIAWGTDVVHPADRETAWSAVQQAIEGGEAYDVTYRIVTTEGETRWVRDRGEGLADGTLSGYVEDVTRLKTDEERLAAELDETFERVSDAFFALDEEWRVTYVNERAAALLGRSIDGLRGATVWAEFEDADAFRRQYEHAMATQERVTFTAHYAPLDAHFEVSAYPSETGLSVYFRDVSERVDRERRLECHEAIVETVWDGVYALDGDGQFTLVNEAYCDLLGVERDDVLGRSAAAVVGDGVTGAARRFTEEMRAGDREEATISFAIERGDGERRQVEVRFGPFVEGGRVGVMRDVTERQRRRRQLRRQRERLGGLVELYDVASDVSNAIVEQTSRAAIEERVAAGLCEGPYAAAWVGRSAGTDVTRVASAGTGGAPSPDDSLVRTALTEGRVVTTTGMADGDAARASARSDGGDDGAAGAVPISYEGGTYGVLVVRAERGDAFEAAERTVLDRLGQTVGHAFAALDRRAALVSEQVVQVEYRSHETGALNVASDARRFHLERTVTTSDGEYVHYARVHGLGREEALAAFADAPAYDGARIVEVDDGVLIEARTTDAPITAAVTGHGGRLRTVRFGSDGVRLTAEFPQGVDLRAATESIREVLLDAELVAQRSMSREDADAPRADVAERLTDRQRAAFEAAYYGGYFEWPRDSTAEELADAMGVAAPTFHQHLREAERKLLGGYVE
ncbi:PAS domain S-box protein [Halarchaeum salinum]|uniref:PAS domain-containing protein n=1 Tax=Halarchaeum salinum TaxID=489912 RepID=A0AAV3S673_9EURY